MRGVGNYKTRVFSEYSSLCHLGSEYLAGLVRDRGEHKQGRRVAVESAGVVLMTRIHVTGSACFRFRSALLLLTCLRCFVPAASNVTALQSFTFSRFLLTLKPHFYLIYYSILFSHIVRFCTFCKSSQGPFFAP